MFGNRTPVEIVQASMKRLTILTLLPTVALLAAGCGGSDSESGSGTPLPDVSAPATVSGPDSTPADLPSDELAGDTVVFVWAESGGCAMGGPNCARYEVRVDGTVETFRMTGTDESGLPAAAGKVDAALVQAWRESLAAEDLEALRERVGDGELTAAFDGVDHLVSNPVTGIELSSVETNFDSAEAVFAAAIALADAAAAAAPLDIEMR